MKIPKPHLICELRPETVNTDDRTVEVTFYSGAQIPRFSWDRGKYLLTFLTGKKNIRLDSLKSGRAPICDSHDSFTMAGQIGVVESGEIRNGAGVARLRYFKNDPQADAVWNKVQQGARNVSMGAYIYTMREAEGSEDGDGSKQFEALDWEPVEVSNVPIGADPNAAIRMVQEELQEVELRPSASKEKTMENQVTNGASKAETIRAIAKPFQLSTEFVDELVNSEKSVEECRTAVLEELARRSDEHQISSVNPAVTAGRDYHEGLAERLAEAEACRYSGAAPSEGAREFSGASIVDKARVCLKAAGIRPPSFSRGEIITLAMQSTSDFPTFLQSTANRMLQRGYWAAEAPIKQICRPSSAPDFRTKYGVRLSEMPTFLQVAEGQQITTAPITETKESYSLATYGRGVSFTRQMLINDDLGAFNDLVGAFGQAAAQLEASQIVTLLTSNSGAGPTMDDTDEMFHTNHGNLAGSGGSIQPSTLSAGRLALRTVTGVDGVTLIEAAPKYLLVPATAETAAEQVLAAIYPVVVEETNPFAGKLELLVEPRLDAVSSTAWFLFADPQVAVTLEYSHLDGAPGPEIVRQENINAVLGMNFYAFIDFGVGALGWRGAYRNAGA